LHDAPSFFMHDVESDFLQHPARGEVNRFELVIFHQLRRLKRIAELLEGGLLEGGACTGTLARASAAPNAVGCTSRFCCVLSGGHGKPHGKLFGANNGPRARLPFGSRRPLERGKRHLAGSGEMSAARAGLKGRATVPQQSRGSCSAPPGAAKLWPWFKTAMAQPSTP